MNFLLKLFRLNKLVKMVENSGLFQNSIYVKFQKKRPEISAKEREKLTLFLCIKLNVELNDSGGMTLSILLVKYKKFELFLLKFKNLCF